ncbi:hypothetical protein [Alteromonas gracilis]|uniref:hypothetical protein n=1 Tax=Alteromonas gracilis TaxID=1479524 RepID=UPI00373507D8
MNRLLLSALFILYFYSFGQATAEEHFLVGVKESGYLFGNTGEILDENKLRETISSKKADRITLIVDKCLNPTRTIDAYIALDGLGINMISLQINPQQRDFECEGT